MKRIPFKKRAFAYVIDVIFAYIISAAAIFILRLNFFPIVGTVTLISIYAGVVLFVYLFLSYLIFNGSSIGRACTGIRIVKYNGQRMNFATCFIRAFMHALIAIAPVSVGYQIFHKTDVSLYEYITETKSVLVNSNKKDELYD